MKIRVEIARLLAVGVCMLSLSGVVFAQTAPNDIGAGIERGIQEYPNSNQDGTVTLYAKGEQTLVRVLISGEPAGRSEPVAIIRGKSCDALENRLGWILQPVVDGRSVTLVNAPATQIDSGNYSVVVHADDHVRGHNLACGELY